MMSLVADEVMNPEEEYLDDPIQLIQQSDNLSSYPEPEEFTAYKHKSYVPVTFFNIDRNIKLLNNCRPLYIKLIDCKLYPYYNEKLNKMNNNFHTNDDDSSDDDMYIENEDLISKEAKRILSKITSNCLTIKVKTKKRNKIKGTDYKKNKGLVGMKISPTFEIIEIDDDSGDLTIDTEKEKQISGEKTVDVISLEVIWTNSNKKYSDLNIPAETIPDSETTEPTKYIPETKHSDVSHDLMPVYEVENFDTNKKVNMHKQETSNVKPIDNVIVENVNKDTSSLKTQNDAKKNEGQWKGKPISDVGCGLNKNIHATSTECVVKTCNLNEKQVSIRSDILITDSGIRQKENDCSKSPILPCMPPKTKKFNKNRHDKSKLLIYHPRDLTYNKFKPNRLTSPKVSNERLSEKLKLTTDGKTECAKTTEDMPCMYSATDVQKQNQEQSMKPNSDPKNIENQNKQHKDTIAGILQVSTVECNFHENSNRNKNGNEIALKFGTGVNNNLSSDDSKALSIKGQTSHKEEIIKLKLDENIYKNAMDKHKLSFKNCKETQRVNVDYILSEVPSHVNETDRLTTAKVSSGKQNLLQTPSIHIADKHFSNSHTIDTILAKSKAEETSKIVSKKDQILKKVGTTFLYEGTTNKIPQGHAYKRPQNVSKCRIRPYTGSVSNWQSMTKELDRSNHFLQSAAPLSNNLDLENSHLNNQHRVMAQKTIPTLVQMQQQNADTVISNNHTSNVNAKNQIAQIVHNQTETSGRNDGIMLARIGLNSWQHSTHITNGAHNVDHILERNRANVSQNAISPHYLQNSCIPSFEPQHRQLIRPITRQDEKQVLGVTDYPRQMYPYTMNMNSLPINPYVGYFNNYNSCWPYPYTIMPPPPPPPPNSESAISMSQPRNQRKVNAIDKNKVNIIKQTHIFPRPVVENLRNNNANRQNLICININNTNSPNIQNTAIVNNSQNVVSSKTEMFAELEKEMMNIHQEDSENY